MECGNEVNYVIAIHILGASSTTCEVHQTSLLASHEATLLRRGFALQCFSFISILMESTAITESLKKRKWTEGIARGGMNV